MTNAIVTGSLQAMARQNGASLAETFLNVDHVLIVDVSGSMEQQDSRGGQGRIDVAQEELERLQATLKGKIALLTFSTTPFFRPMGTLGMEGGSTDLAQALRFARVADLPGIDFTVISDGEPDSESQALKEAALYKASINTVYVGPEGGAGQEFLKRLAHAGHGSDLRVGVERMELEASITKLLAA